MQKPQQSTTFKEKALETSTFVNELFNINYENLQEFLEKTVNVINSHAKSIALLEEQLKTKLTFPPLEESLSKMAENIKFPDNELYKAALSSVPEKPLPELTGNKIEENTNKICNKMNLLTTALGISYKKNKEFEGKIAKLEGDFAKKVSKEELKEKAKKIKKKLNDAIEDQRIKITRKVDDLDKKMAGALAHMEVLVKDVEKKTIWKIQDCETLLQKRINNEYVDNSIKVLEERLRKEMQMLSEGNFSNINKNLSELKDKLNMIENTNNEKYKTLKKQFIDLEETLGLKCLSLEKFEEFKRGIFDKLNEYFKMIKDLEKRGDPYSIFKPLEDSLTSLKDRVNDIEKKTNAANLDINDIKISLSKFEERKPEETKGEKNMGVYDPHKICALEADQKKMKEDLHEYKHMVREFEKDLKKKIEGLETKIINSLALLKQDDNKFQSLREDLLSYFDKTQLNLMEKMKAINKEIEELWKKLSPLSDMDKKIRKLSQKLDLDQILKQLQTKAESSDIAKDLGLLDEKIKGNNELFNQLRREFEKIEAFYNEFATLLHTNPQETVTTFIGNNSVTKSRCLCCGVKGKNMNYSLYGMSHMHGTDGKVYRADLKPGNLYEGQEVYDLSSNQIETILNKSGGNLDVSKSYIAAQNNTPQQTIGNSSFLTGNQTLKNPNPILPAVNEKSTAEPEKQQVLLRKNSKQGSKTGKYLRPDSAKK